MKLGARFKTAFDILRFGTTITAERNGSSYFIPLMSSSGTYRDIELLDMYFDIPELAAILNMRANMKSRMKIKLISKTTGEPVKNYESIVRVLRNPNWFQSGAEFWKQSSIFYDLFGDEFLYFNSPYGFSLNSAKSMFTLPPYMVKVETQDERPFYLYDTPDIDYTFIWGTEEYLIEKDRLLHLNNNRVKMNKQDWASGESLLTTQRAVLNNIKAAYEARGVLITNRGALGILSNEGKDVAGVLPMDQKEKESLQNELKNYGLSSKKWQWIITNLAVKWQQISTDDAHKIGLYDEVREDFMKLCDVYGIAPEMFAKIDGTTFENQKWGERKTWENTIIPECQQKIDALNNQLDTANRSWELAGTFDHIAVLQENLRERAQGLTLATNALSRAFQDGAISLEEYQRELSRYSLNDFGR